MLRPFQTLRGARLAASNGEIGHVRDFYFDDATWRVRYFVVNTGSWLFGREVLIVPDTLGEVDLSRRVISINLSREQVSESPPLDVDKPVSRQHEEELHRYYGWSPYWLPADDALGTTLSPAMFVPPPVPAPPDAEPNLASEDRHADPHLRSASELMSGYTIHARDGEIGRVDDFILDDGEWSVRYLAIHTGAWFLGKDALLPPARIERISYEQAEVFVDVSRKIIKEAPPYHAADAISAEYERLLQEHYSVTGQ